MKLLFIILSLFLFLNSISCSKTEENLATPKFRYGTRVYVPGGFYEGSKGRVIKFYVSGNEITYSIEIQLIGKDGKSDPVRDMDFRESELIEDASY